MKNMRSHNTLLVNYIKVKIDRYREPERKGTPKGDPVGFSLVKHKSVLLALTSLKVKDIANMLNVSYGLVRVWRTEELYKQQLDVYAREFAAQLVSYFTSSTDDSYQLYSVKEDRDTKTPGAGFYSMISDVAIYSDALMEKIYEEVKKAGARKSWDRDKAFYSHLANLFTVRKSIGEYSKNQCIENVAPEELTVFSFSEAIQKPWSLDKGEYEQFIADFTRCVEALL